MSAEDGTVVDYDVIVIGCGSGNTLIDDRFAHLRVAMIDAGAHFGGTCLTAGCIPTKMLVHVADLVHEIRDADRFGVAVAPPRVRWPEVRERVFARRIDPISNGGERYRRELPFVTLYRERFRFTGPHTLEGDSGVRITAPRIVIAAGSRPRRLSVFDGVSGVHTSDDIMRLEELPRRVLIVGGGSIATEFAHILKGLGSEVVISVAHGLMRKGDREVAAAITAIAGREYDLVRARPMQAASRDGEITVHFDNGAVRAVDGVLVAAGRIPNTDLLGLAEVGYDVDEHGFVRVDDELRVLRGGEPANAVWALGDIDNPHQLKHVANYEARVVRHNLLADLRAGDAAQRATPARAVMGPVPLATFGVVQIASFGHTLDSARAAGIDAVEARHDYGATAWGWALEDGESFAKITLERSSGRIIGSHIIGPDAAILVQLPLMLAADDRDVRGYASSLYWPHPAATEIIENLLLKAEEALDERAPARPAAPDESEDAS